MTSSNRQFNSIEMTTEILPDVRNRSKVEKSPRSRYCRLSTDITHAPHIGRDRFGAIVRSWDNTSRQKLASTWKKTRLFLFAILLFTLCLQGTVAQEAALGPADAGDDGTNTTIMTPETLDSDISALKRVYKALNLSDVLIWDLTTDPCQQAWPNIACSCDFDASLAEVRDHCSNFTQGNVSRVVFLRIAATKADENPISGPLPEALGRLDALRWLDLSNNYFSGPIPDAFKNLTNLEYLSLADNQLTGRLPDYFGGFNLKTLRLDTNFFEGKIPQEWCWSEDKLFAGLNNTQTTLTLHKNPNLCGKLPGCVKNQINTVEGTWIISNNATAVYQEENHSGVCDDTAPFCLADSGGCDIIVAKNWTSNSNVSFSFYAHYENRSEVVKYGFYILKSSNPNPTDPSIPYFNVFHVDEPFIHAINVTNTTIKTTNTREEVIDVRKANDTETEEDINEEIIRYDVVVNPLALEVSLEDGAHYVVILIVFNNAGPPVNLTTRSPDIFVDVSPPEIGTVYNTCQNKTVTSLDMGDPLCVSWNSVVDVHSNVSAIHVTLEKRKSVDDFHDNEEFKEVVNMTVSVNDNGTEFDRGILEAEAVYRFRITVTNEVNLVAKEYSSAFQINAKRSGLWFRISLVARISIVLAAIIIALISVIACMICTHVGKNKAGEVFQAQAYLKKYVYEMLGLTDEDVQIEQCRLVDKEHLALVVTDIESSTAQANKSDAGFKKMIEVHDMTLKEAITKYGGNELANEGDSFVVAFASVSHAVSFALTAQEELLRYRWPKEVLRLPKCQTEKGISGEVIFAGARIRIGIHWANLTGFVEVASEAKQRILESPALALTKRISDAGNGGQILLTHLAWEQLRQSMAQCKFPTVSQLGLYRWRGENDTFTLERIYTVTERLGKSLGRHFDGLRFVEQLSKGEGLNIIPCPQRAPNGMLTFVATRLEAVRNEFLQSNYAEVVYATLASKVQLFQGHILYSEKRRMQLLIVFAQPIDAVRFAHIAQVSLVLTKWPIDISKLFPEQASPNSDIPLFNGPRIAMAIHTTGDIQTDTYSGSGAQDAPPFFDGPGIEFVGALADACDGGQIVLSENTWRETQQQMPLGSRIISLGKHIVGKHVDSPLLLFETIPEVLVGRKFRPVQTAKQTEPGYYEAPSIKRPFAISFATVVKPKAVAMAEKEADSDTDANHSSTNAHAISAVYSAALDTYASMLRQSLQIFDGYECKRMNGEKFLVAFKEFRDAILWACYLQSEMLKATWPDELLLWDECKVQLDDCTRRVISRGLQLRVGVAFGKIARKTSTPAGDADYTGMTVILAERLMTFAQPGQILIQPGNGFDENDVNWIRKGEERFADVGIMTFPEGKNCVMMSEVAVEIVGGGTFLPKGRTEATRYYRAQVSSLAVKRMPVTKPQDSQTNENMFRGILKSFHMSHFVTAAYDRMREIPGSFNGWPHSKKVERLYPSYYQSTIESHDVDCRLRGDASNGIIGCPGLFRTTSSTRKMNGSGGMSELVVTGRRKSQFPSSSGLNPAEASMADNQV